MDSVKTDDRCVHCGFPFKEHSYNGACYGICGQFVAVAPAASPPAGAEVVAKHLPNEAKP